MPINVGDRASMGNRRRFVNILLALSDDGVATKNQVEPP